jgi:hypothetical protein
LREISPNFTPAKYDLFKWNCNNFSDELCKFVVGKPIPEFITGLPASVRAVQLSSHLFVFLPHFSCFCRCCLFLLVPVWQVLNTPFGQMIAPMMANMQSSMMQQGGGGFVPWNEPSVRPPPLFRILLVLFSHTHVFFTPTLFLPSLILFMHYINLHRSPSLHSTGRRCGECSHATPSVVLVFGSSRRRASPEGGGSDLGGSGSCNSGGDPCTTASNV